MKKWTLTLLWLITLVASPAMGSLHNARFPDGKPWTLYAIQFTGALSGAAEGDIVSITITGPRGVLGYPRENFSYSETPDGWRGLFYLASGEPETGNYSFTIASATTSVMTDDQQTSIKEIPVADTAGFAVLGNTFSWGAVSLPGTDLYYRLQIVDASGRNVYFSAYEKDALSNTIPGDILTPGQTYRWRVRISDNSDFDAIQNESFSTWVEFTYSGLGSVLIQYRVWGDGRIENRMQFQLKDGSNQNVTRSVSLSEIKVYDPNGQPVNLTETTFFDVAIGTYNAQTGQWNYPAPSFDTYGYALFSDPLIVGLYTIKVTHNGETYAGSSSFKGLVNLPKVDPSTFVLTWAPNGDLTWSWRLPEGLCSGNTVYTPAVITVYKQGQQFGNFFFRTPNGQCVSSLLIPASFVQSINAMADEVELLVDIRTNTHNNAYMSSPLVLTQLAPPALAEIRGKISDWYTGDPIPGSTISLEPGSITLTSQADGTFHSSVIPSVTYSVVVTAPGYNSESIKTVSLSPGPFNQLDLSLIPYLPKVISTSTSENEIGNDGQGTTLLTARITHPLGLSSIDTVVANLESIGGSAEQIFYDNGTHGDQIAGDGTYSYKATVAKGTNAKPYVLVVTATDVMGKEGSNHISLKVKDKVAGTVPPSDSVSQDFNNTLGGQTLNIHFDFTRAPLSLKVLKSDCQVQLTILGPNGEQYGPYSVTDSIDVSIPNAAPGKWEYVTNNFCASALSYEVETSGGGTGVLVGRVVDGLSGAGVSGATINCNTGGTTVSLAQGYYSTVVVAGSGQVVTSKAGYQTNVRQGVHVKAGGTSSLNIRVVPENASAQAVPSGVHIFNILDPAEDPKPPTQPFAIKVSGSGLEFNIVFPRYQQVVDLYLAFVPGSGPYAGKLFLVDENNSIVEFGGTLHAWKRASTQEESAQIPIPGEYPLGAYTLYSLVTTDSSTLANYDLSYFATTPPQPAPVGQNVTFLPNPTEEPNPLTQPLAAKVTDGNLALNAHFPVQKEPVSIFLAYLTPGGELYLIKSDNTTEQFSGTLWPWRQDITAPQAGQVLSIPMAQMAPGIYYYYSLVTTDPAALSNYELIYFSMNVTQ